MNYRMGISWTGIVFTISGLIVTAEAASFQPDAARVEQIAKRLPEQPRGAGRSITDRAAWEKLAERPEWKGMIAEAEKLLKEDMPQLTEELYLDYSRTGNRDRYQAVYFALQNRIKTLVFAECLENKGRFIPAIEQGIMHFCSIRSWTMPAHDGGLTDFQGKEDIVALGSSAWGWMLANTDYVLGEKLSPAVRKTLRENVRRRILDPIRSQLEGQEKMYWWFTATMNWNSVCLANVTGAALAMIEDRKERAFYAAAAEHYIQNFLKGFTEDGYCSEGVGYWNYGYGNFLVLSELIWQQTGGKLNLLDSEAARRPARYGFEIQMTERISPAFSDCSINARPNQWMLTYLAWHLDQPWVKSPADFTAPTGNLNEILLFCLNSSILKLQAEGNRLPEYKRLAAHSWFDKAGVLICRPGENKACRMAAALKGGHNDEHHNHNDVGSYAVVVDDVLLLADPGSEVYTKRTFGGRRYESRALNSYGHPVPIVAGKLQRTGKEACAKILKAEFTDQQDTLEMNYTSAYDVPALRELTRTFVYSRDEEGSLEIQGKARFSEPEKFEDALITFGKVKQIRDDLLEVWEGDTGVRIKIGSNHPFTIKQEVIDEDFRTGRQPTRIGIVLNEPVSSAEISVNIMPIETPK